MPIRRSRSNHTRKRRRRPETREAASVRGYDRTWGKTRTNYANKNPLCEHCLKRGKTNPMAEVDHIIPFQGPGDPLRLDWSNLQSLCKSCHRKKTARDQKD